MIGDQRPNPPTHSGLQIEFELPSNEEGPTAWSEEICGGGYQTDHPVIRATLNQKCRVNLSSNTSETINPYQLLKSFTIKEIQIEGDVSQSKNFTAQNQFGPLKTSKPFAPFGENPSEDSEFYLGNCEAFTKSLDYLFTQIQWYDLPKSPVGFSQRYAYYNRFGPFGTNYTNGAFLWSVDIRHDEKWNPLTPLKLQSSATPPTSTVQSSSTPLFQWNNLPPALASRYASSISFSPAKTSISTADEQSSDSPPSLPPLPTMSPLNIGPLLPDTFLILSAQSLSSTKNARASAPFTPETLYTGTQENGFLRLTLQTPENGFGFQQYPDIVASVSNYNVSLISEKASPAGPDEEKNSKPPPPKDPPAETKKDKPADNKKNELATAAENLGASVVSDLGGLAKLGLRLAGKAAKFYPNPIVQVVAKAAGVVEDDEEDSPTEAPIDPPPDKSLLKPPPPAWVPKIKELSLSYGNSERLLDPQSENSPISFYQLHPFGFSKPFDKNDTSPPRLVPDYPSEGSLYIGLENTDSPETITLLFQLDESSGDSLVSIPKPEWYFLGDKGWTSISPNNLLDGTDGFSQSGIVSLTLIHPHLANSNLLRSKPSLLWIRVSIPDNIEAACRTISVTSQSVSAVYKSGADPNTHFSAPLPAQTIKSTVTPVEGLLKVDQPSSSTGGIPPESSIQFYARVFERLRHKDRAITSWDYECLILQDFPQIRASKTLNSTTREKGSTPGSTMVLVFPEITPDHNPLRPQVARPTLTSIQRTIAKRCDPFVTVKIHNPEFIFLSVSAVIELVPGGDPHHDLELINKLLIEEIAPWSSSSSTCNPFSTSISYGSILQFLLAQKSVHDVQKLDLFLISPKDIPSKSPLLHTGNLPLEPPNSWTLISSVTQHSLTLATGEPLAKPSPLSPTGPTLSTTISPPSPLIKPGNTIFLGGDH